MLTEDERLNTNKLVVGGLHKDDFEWASKQYKEYGYDLIAFVLDHDGYHWKAVYTKSTAPETSGDQPIES